MKACVGVCRGMKNKAVKGEEKEEEEWKMREEGRCVFSCCIVGGFTQTVQCYHWPCDSSLLQFICRVLFSDWEGQTMISGNVKEEKEEEMPSLPAKIFMASLLGWSQISQTSCSFQIHLTVDEFQRYSLLMADGGVAPPPPLKIEKEFVDSWSPGLFTGSFGFCWSITFSFTTASVRKK